MIDHLRVVDGSILPKIPSADVNAPTITAAGKISAAVAKVALKPGVRSKAK